MNLKRNIFDSDVRELIYLKKNKKNKNNSVYIRFYLKKEEFNVVQSQYQR